MSTRRHHGRTIDTSIRLKASPQQAWDAWADPEQIANWFVDRAEGRAAPGEVMTWFFDTFNVRQPVPIVDAERGRSLVIGSGDAPGPQGHPYLMEITIASEAGETTLRLVNSGFSEDARFDEEFEGVVSGWKMALATLKAWLEHYPGQRRTHRLALQPAAYALEGLRPFFATADGRAQWLNGLVPAAGIPLADTGREVLLNWPDERAVLGLKAFRMGPQRMLALDYSAWRPDRPPSIGNGTDVAPRLEQALTRLTAHLR
jgi:uncharacterized protein YndB with AHSA1/START domain